MLKNLCICLFALLTVAGVNAAPRIYLLQGITFADGGTATGSFAYDPATNTYSSVDITTTNGSVRNGAVYHFVCGQDVPTCTGVTPTSSGALNLTSAAADQTGLPGFALFFTPPLSAGTATVQVSGLEATCVDPACTAPTAPERPVTAGTVVLPAFEISYAANLNVGDSVINITNTGARGAGLASGTTASTTGAICANVYAFSPDEQMIACCSCPVTPNGLVSLSARSDLISNTLTPAVPTSIVVKVLASAPVSGSCIGSAASATAPLSPGMEAWGTSVHATPVAGTFAVTEKPFSLASLSVGELVRLKALCTFIVANGSGFGVCRSCRLGGLGAEKQ